jgi:hypothetical protein
MQIRKFVAGAFILAVSFFAAGVSSFAQPVALKQAAKLSGL